MRHMEHTTLIALMDRLAAATGRSPRTISRLTAGSGDVYDRLKAGRDITIRRASRIIRSLSDRWPADIDWPPEIPRPTRHHEDTP